MCFRGSARVLLLLQGIPGSREWEFALLGFKAWEFKQSPAPKKCARGLLGVRLAGESFRVS